MEEKSFLPPLVIPPKKKINIKISLSPIQSQSGRVRISSPKKSSRSKKRTSPRNHPNRSHTAEPVVSIKPDEDDEEQIVTVRHIHSQRNMYSQVREADAQKISSVSPFSPLSKDMSNDRGVSHSNDTTINNAIGGRNSLSKDNSSLLQIDVSLFEDVDGDATIGSSKSDDASPLEGSGDSCIQLGLNQGETGQSDYMHILRDKSSRMKHRLFPIERLLTIGKGSSATVYKSVHLTKLAVVAEKVVVAVDNSKRQQLVSELKSLSTILRGDKPCPYIVQLVDVLTNPYDGTVSVCLEFMDGGSLQDIVTSGGCQDEVVLAGIAHQILSGVAYLHSKRHIHRDIKPGNLLIDGHGRVKISDFGLARAMEQGQSLADTFVGTFCYMAPERIAGQQYSFASDVWSVGLSVMACALGRYPYAVSTDKGYWALLQAIIEQPVPLLSTPRNNSTAINDNDALLVESANDHTTGGFLTQAVEDEVEGSATSSRFPGDSHKFSDSFRSFLESSCSKTPESRPAAQALLAHTFLRLSTHGTCVSDEGSDRGSASDPRAFGRKSQSWLLQRASSTVSLGQLVAKDSATQPVVRNDVQEKSPAGEFDPSKKPSKKEPSSEEKRRSFLRIERAGIVEGPVPPGRLGETESESGRERPGKASQITQRVVAALKKDLLQHWAVGLKCSADDPPFATWMLPEGLPLTAREGASNVGEERGKGRGVGRLTGLAVALGVTEQELRGEVLRMLLELKEGVSAAMQTH